MNCAQVEGVDDQAHAFTQGIEGLVYVAPDDRPHIAVPVDERQEFLCVLKPYLVQPLTRHRNGVMMEADHA